MYERILVPLDGSRLAEVALDHAVQLATRFGSQLVLLRVVSPPGLASIPASTPNAEGEVGVVAVDFVHGEAEVQTASEYLDGLRANLRAEGLGVTTRVLEGQPVPEILDYAETAGISLIVMSTHGTGSITRSELGSVAGDVLRQSKIPLQIIPYR